MFNEDPLAWDRQVRLLAEFDQIHRTKLRLDPETADATGPFVGVPAITERAAFVQLRELPGELPLRRALARWMYRLADARVNGALLRNWACYWRNEQVGIDSAKGASFSRAALLRQLLCDEPARTQWLRELERALSGTANFVSDLWQRRQELAERAGFDSLAAVLDPVEGLVELSEKWRAASDAISSEVLPRNALPLLEVALSTRARQGWPVRIAAQSMAGLLGERTWLRLALVKEPAWPQLIGPASFVLALNRLGQTLAKSWAPESHPFVLVHDPWNLEGHRLGALVSSLPLNESWQRRVLGLSKDRAKLQVRELARGVLLLSRGLCLKLGLRAAAVQSSKALEGAFAESMGQLFGFTLPACFAGILPRIRRSDAQHLVGIWLGLSEHEQLIQTFDEDWYRNPRAIETLRGQSSEISRSALNPESLAAALAASASWLKSRLDG